MLFRSFFLVYNMSMLSMVRRLFSLMFNNESQLSGINSSNDLTLTELNHKIEEASQYEWWYDHHQIIITISIIFFIVGVLLLMLIIVVDDIFKPLLSIVGFILLVASFSFLISLYEAKDQTEKKGLLIEQRQDLKNEQQQKQKAKELKRQSLQYGKVQSVKLNDKTIQIKVNNHNYQAVDKYQDLTNDGLADDVSKGSDIKYKIIDNRINITEVEK